MLREGCEITFDELFSKCDKDNNKLLHRDEFSEILKEANEGLAKIQFIVNRQFDIADVNNDNSLSYEEAFNSFEKHFRFIYKNLMTADLIYIMKDGPKCESCNGYYWQDGPHL